MLAKGITNVLDKTSDKRRSVSVDNRKKGNMGDNREGKEVNMTFHSK